MKGERQTQTHSGHSERYLSTHKHIEIWIYMYIEYGHIYMLKYGHTHTYEHICMMKSSLEIGKGDVLIWNQRFSALERHRDTHRETHRETRRETHRERHTERHRERQWKRDRERD